MNALLRQQIQTELAAIGSSASILHSSARPDKLYEIFILSCVIRALKDIGATLDARDSVSGHFDPASNGRNDPATIIDVSRHFSSKQARYNLLISGLFERKMPLSSQHFA